MGCKWTRSGWVVLGAMMAPNALAVAPAAGQLTEPIYEVPRTAQRQFELSNDPAWRDIARRWGGAWRLRFDERTGRLRSAMLPGVSLALADVLLDDVAPYVDLVPAGVSQRGELRFERWQQHIDGLPVWGSEVALAARAGRVFYVQLRTFDVPLGVDATGADVWFPVGKRLVPATLDESGDEVWVRGLDGVVLAHWSTRHYTTADLTYEERTVGDALLLAPLRDVQVDDGGAITYTDAAGAHSAADPYDLILDGTRLTMRDARYSGSISLLENSGDVELGAGAELDYAVADTFAHSRIVRDWVERVDPAHPILDINIRATVNIGSRCNAYYTSGTINFFQAGSGCANTGRLADVVYHEIGHGIHHYGLTMGSFAGNISEGASDYVAATLTGDPDMGLGFRGVGTTLRNIDTDRFYPDDLRGEVHHDGLIWASFLWNLREMWVADYGEDAGAALADRLFLDTLAFGPTFTTAADAVVLADDDDGDLSNGTPHGCELVELLDYHGLGPGALGVVMFEHDPLGPQSSWAATYPVDFAVLDATPDCSSLDVDSVRLWWTTDLPTDDDTADLFPGRPGWTDGGGDPDDDYVSASGATWHSLTLGASGAFYEGEFPRQVATTELHYFIEVWSLEGEDRLVTHSGQADGVYSFYVGTREEVWCEDFDGLSHDFTSGAGTPWASADSDDEDKWGFGRPNDSGWDPSSAVSPNFVAATVLADSGNYRAWNTSYLRSPAIDVPEGRMVQLTFQRWLTVEDALYDQARVYLGDDLMWANPRTSGGIDHLLDRAWTEQVFPLDSTPAGDTVQLTWTLKSDGGLEYGGWTLDDVCVSRLADVPGHYRVRDFAASDDGLDDVALSWTNPWIEPLRAIRVVRGQFDFPTDVFDGVVVADITDPTAGAVHQVLDTDEALIEGWSYHYAVFAEAEEGQWFPVSILEGENADRGGLASPPDTDLPEDTGVVANDTGDAEQPTEPVDDDIGCGCNAVSITPLWGLVGVLALLRRRRHDGAPV